jgi:hypothetical protein
MATAQQMDGNRPARWNLSAGQRMIGRADRFGNPPEHLEPLIEAHYSPQKQRV